MKVVLGLAVLLVSAVAHARGPCTADIEKLCSDVKPGEGRVHACLEAHDNDLSNNCKSERRQRKEYHDAWVAACTADHAKFCKDVKPGNGRLDACLNDHINELAPSCHDKIVHGSLSRRIVGACGKSLKATCPSATTFAEKNACLNEHLDTLSPACAVELDPAH